MGITLTNEGSIKILLTKTHYENVLYQQNIQLSIDTDGTLKSLKTVNMLSQFNYDTIA